MLESVEFNNLKPLNSSGILESKTIAHISFSARLAKALLV
jgi:hypothetical protein